MASQEALNNAARVMEALQAAPDFPRDAIITTRQHKEREKVFLSIGIPKLESNGIDYTDRVQSLVQDTLFIEDIPANGLEIEVVPFDAQSY